MSFNSSNYTYEGNDDDNDDSLKLQLKMITKKKQKERSSIFRNENLLTNEERYESSVSTTTSEILKRFNLTKQQKSVTPSIRFDVTLQPNLSIRGDKLKASKSLTTTTTTTTMMTKEEIYKNYHSINLGHAYNTKTNANNENKSKFDPRVKNSNESYFSLPVHIRSRNRDQPSTATVIRHNSDLSRVHSPFTYIETFSIKRRNSLSPQVLIKKARIIINLFFFLILFSILTLILIFKKLFFIDVCQ